MLRECADKITDLLSFCRDKELLYHSLLLSYGPFSLDAGNLQECIVYTLNGERWVRNQGADAALGQEGDITGVTRLVIETFKGRRPYTRNMLDRFRDDGWTQSELDWHIRWCQRVGQ